MARIPLDSLDDLRLEVYRDLKRARPDRDADLFIAEGDKVAHRLLESDFEVMSVLVSDRREARFAPLLRPGLDWLVIPHEMAAGLTGFTFHAGIMACGRRKPQPELGTLDRAGTGNGILAACARVDDPENIGAIIRLCAAFGAGGLLIGPGCPDPFSRRVLRVSMGNAFRLPIRECADLRGDLERLRDGHGWQLVGTATAEGALPPDEVQPAEKSVLLFGNEAHGLGADMLGLCDLQVAIPMRREVDSLNVAAAAAILLYHYTRPRQQ